MLTYSQATGKLARDGVLLALCYAGRGFGLNDPFSQQVRNVGPIPQGQYILHKIEGAAAKAKKLGPVIFYLEPFGSNQMFNRSQFYIHWDNGKRDYSASEGCIVPLTTAVFTVLKDGETLTVL